MIQLWVNLPARQKMSTPRYQGIVDSQIPQVSLPDGAGTVRIIAGEFQGVRGPATTFTPINAWDLHLNAMATASILLPEGQTALLVVQSGMLQANDQPLKAVELALFERSGELVALRAETPSRILLLTGEPLNEPVVGQVPFVMNSREQIREAIADFQAGRMGRL